MHACRAGVRARVCECARAWVHGYARARRAAQAGAVAQGVAASQCESAVRVACGVAVGPATTRPCTERQTMTPLVASVGTCCSACAGARRRASRDAEKPSLALAAAAEVRPVRKGQALLRICVAASHGRCEASPWALTLESKMRNWPLRGVICVRQKSRRGQACRRSSTARGHVDTQGEQTAHLLLCVLLARAGGRETGMPNSHGAVTVCMEPSQSAWSRHSSNAAWSA
eukprot:3374384-Pleurochrysis_carterae.AAC.1